MNNTVAVAMPSKQAGSNWFETSDATVPSQDLRNLHFRSQSGRAVPLEHWHRRSENKKHADGNAGCRPACIDKAQMS